MTTLHCDRCRAEIDVTAIETALAELRKANALCAIASHDHEQRAQQLEIDCDRHRLASAHWEDLAAKYRTERDEARAECERLRGSP